MEMNRLIILSIICLAASGLAEADMIQHLDATVSESVTGSPVTHWTDQSGSTTAYNAAPGIGNVYYPGSSLSASGLEGLDFGTDRNTLQLFDASGQDSWLNQVSGGGFAVLVAFKADSWNDLIGNSSSATTEGFWII